MSRCKEAIGFREKWEKNTDNERRQTFVRIMRAATSRQYKETEDGLGGSNINTQGFFHIEHKE